MSKIQPLSAALLAESKAKMDELARKDKERVMLEEARNKVESYSYYIKNRLIDYEEEVAKVSTEEQREEIRKLASDAADWLDFDAYDADLPTMEAKYKEMSEPAEKIWFRMKELKARPEAIAALNTKLDKVDEILKKWETTMPHVTEEEKDEVREKLATVRVWIQEKLDAQDAKASHEEPAFTSEEVPLQSKAVERLVMKLSKKPKPVSEEKKAENQTESDGNSTTPDAEGAANDTEPAANADAATEEAKTEETDAEDSKSEEKEEKKDDEL